MKNFAVLTLTLLVLTVLPGCIVISSQKSYKPDQHAQPDQCRHDSDRTSVIAQIDAALELPTDNSIENVLTAIASRPDLSDKEQIYLAKKALELPTDNARENVLMALAKNPGQPKPQTPPPPAPPADANK